MVVVSHLQSHKESGQKNKGPDPRTDQEKFSGERKRGFFLACLPLCRCVSAVCLSSCVCLGSSGPGWSGFCRVRCFVSCCFRGASFLVGAVPKTGNDTLGIPLPRFYLDYGPLLDSLFSTFSLLSTLRRLVSRAVAAAVSGSLSSKSCRRRSTIGRRVYLDFTVSFHRQVCSETGSSQGLRRAYRHDV